MAFPVSIPGTLTIGPTTTAGSIGHGSIVHVSDRNDIIALATKVGLGSSTPSGTVAMLGTGAGTSAWGQITNSYVSPSAAIAVTKLGTVTASRPLVSDAGGTVGAGTISTGMIAANAVTQNGFAPGSTGTATTTSGSYVDLADMSVTLTTTGGDLLVVFNSALANTSLGAAIVIALKLDAAAEVAAFSLNTNVATYTYMGLCVYRFTGVSAASHTVKVRWLTNAGTASANGNDRYLLVVELKK